MKNKLFKDIFKKGDIKPANFSAEFDIVEYTSLQPNLHKWFYDDTKIEGVAIPCFFTESAITAADLL